MLTCSGNHDRPSSAIRPSDPNVIAGSLLPVELPCGAVVKPAGGLQLEISKVFEKAGGEAPTELDPPTIAGIATTATTATIVLRRNPDAIAHLPPAAPTVERQTDAKSLGG